MHTTRHAHTRDNTHTHTHTYAGTRTQRTYLEIFSLPARSTRFSLPILITSSPSAVVSFMWMVMVKIE